MLEGSIRCKLRTKRAFTQSPTDTNLFNRLLGVILKSYSIVFIASACGLIIEIVAARILAPSIGVSLYTWTSVIGVVLAGFSTGNYFGGRVADRASSPRLCIKAPRR